MYFSSKHRSHKLARLKVDDEVGHVKSQIWWPDPNQGPKWTRWRLPGSSSMAQYSLWSHQERKEPFHTTQLESGRKKKLGLRFQTSLYFKLKLLSRTMSLLSYTSDRPKIRFGQTFWQCLVSSVSDKEWENFASSVVPIFAIFWIKMYWFFHEIPIWIFSIRKWEYVHFFQVRFNYPTRPNKGQ